MDRFRTMESFVRVVRAGSFTVAANQLGLSRALVSRHIGDFEARLGVKLLNRTTRSLNLTGEGQSYLDFCGTRFPSDRDERAGAGEWAHRAGGYAQDRGAQILRAQSTWPTPSWTSRACSRACASR